MPPSFLNFKELRRRSRASFLTEKSTDTSSDGSHSHGRTPTSGSLTPPSLHNRQSDSALHLHLQKDAGAPLIPQRPALAPVGNKRFSVSGMTGLGSPAMGPRVPSLPVSQYSPRVSNINDNTWVRCLLLGTPQQSQL